MTIRPWHPAGIDYSCCLSVWHKQVQSDLQSVLVVFLSFIIIFPLSSYYICIICSYISFKPGRKLLQLLPLCLTQAIKSDLQFIQNIKYAQIRQLNNDFNVFSDPDSVQVQNVDIFLEKSFKWSWPSRWGLTDVSSCKTNLLIKYQYHSNSVID